MSIFIYNNVKKLLPACLLAALPLMTGCMDGDWDEPATDGTEFGSQYIQESNVVTIASLKQQYKTVIENGDLQQFTKPTQIKGIVTANDIEGNIYSEVAIDDGTGAMLVCVGQGGLFAQLPVGQEVIVELNGLYIGGYGKQPEIGTPYTNKNGRTYVSRMSRMVWQDHYRTTGYRMHAEPVEFDKTKVSNATYIADNCGKLMTIKDVKFQNAANLVYADEESKDAANCVNRTLQGISSNSLVVRTSTYADFAALPLPTGTCDITGIFTRYNNTWQILIREISDVKEK